MKQLDLWFSSGIFKNGARAFSRLGKENMKFWETRADKSETFGRARGAESDRPHFRIIAKPKDWVLLKGRVENPKGTVVT